MNDHLAMTTNSQHVQISVPPMSPGNHGFTDIRIPALTTIPAPTPKTTKNDIVIKMVASIFFSSIYLIFGICSLYYATTSSSETCFTKYNGISFTYLQWLFIHGIVNCAIASIIIISIFFCKSEKNLPITSCLGTCILLFTCAWFIVGSILYFTTVNPHCDSGLPITMYGLALFIIQIIFRGCGI